MSMIIHSMQTFYDTNQSKTMCSNLLTKMTGFIVKKLGLFVIIVIMLPAVARSERKSDFIKYILFHIFIVAVLGSVYRYFLCSRSTPGVGNPENTSSQASRLATRHIIKLYTLKVKFLSLE